DAEFLAQVGHHVDERDLGREKAVGRLLDQFGGRDARGDDRAVEVGLVEVEQQRSRAVGIGADDDPVRLQEVADRRALAEEFRIAGDIELMLRSGQAPDRGVDPVSGPGAWIVGVPSERRATMSGSLSIAVTVWPTSARPTAVTNPA